MDDAEKQQMEREKAEREERLIAVLSDAVSKLTEKNASISEQEAAEERKRKNYRINAWHRFIDNWLSVKVWGLAAYTAISTVLVFKSLITGADWVQGNGTVYSIIYGVREVYKIEKTRTNGHEPQPPI